MIAFAHPRLLRKVSGWLIAWRSWSEVGSGSDWPTTDHLTGASEWSRGVRMASDIGELFEQLKSGPIITRSHEEWPDNRIRRQQRFY